MFSKTVINGFVVFISSDKGGTEEITETEYQSIMQKIQNKPTPPNGYTYKLRADNLEWELTEITEPVDEEAEISDYENALSDMGVRFGD